MVRHNLPAMNSRQRLARVYFSHEMPAHGVLDLPPDQSHHIAHVLRLDAGDALTVFDGEGFEYRASVERMGKSGVTLRVGEAVKVDRESPLAVILAQGISGGDRMDYTVQKAVELGVHAIQPLSVERSVVRLSEQRAAKRLAHWRSVAVAACGQCGRNRVPPVLEVTSFARWLGAQADDETAQLDKLMLAPDASSGLAAIDRPHGRLVLLVGAEGGLSARERDDAQAAGFKSVRLGPRVLRTETAALAALAAMQTLWGDF